MEEDKFWRVSLRCRAESQVIFILPTPGKGFLGLPFFVVRSEFMRCSFNNLIMKRPRKSNCQANHMEMHLAGASQEACLDLLGGSGGGMPAAMVGSMP
jgi:hypothetical protein